MHNSFDMAEASADKAKGGDAELWQQAGKRADEQLRGLKEVVARRATPTPTGARVAGEDDAAFVARIDRDKAGSFDFNWDDRLRLIALARAALAREPLD